MTQRREWGGARRGVLRVAGAAMVGGAAALGAGGLAASTYVARRILTPEREYVADVEILDVSDVSVTLRRSELTLRPGHYGLFFDGDRGHLRIGLIETGGLTADAVRRELVAVDAGVPRPGLARWDAYFWCEPPDVSLGMATEHVLIDGELGALPAWIVPGRAEGAHHGAWAVLVHGRGATREEALRALGPLHELGVTCVVPMYRNDIGAPAGRRGLYALGLAEWRDVDAAARLAVARGAQSLVLVGWSMGGAVVMQTLSRWAFGDLLGAVVLDGPVLSWPEVLEHQAGLNRAPAAVARLAGRLMTDRAASSKLVGLPEPLDLARTDWVARADELEHPMLVIHSSADDVVPNRAAHRLAGLRPDLITLVDDGVAGHCQEWNVDPGGWERLVSDYVDDRLSARAAR